MECIYIIVILLSFSSIAFFVWLSDKNMEKCRENKDTVLPYKKKEYLMTIAEREFWETLKEVVKDRYYIVPQVVISDIVYVSINGKNYYKYRSKIDKKRIDFVIFSKDTFTPGIAIELDDSTHNREDRIDRDHFVDSVMEQVGIKIVHIKTAYKYNLEELAKTIFNN